MKKNFEKELEKVVADLDDLVIYGPKTEEEVAEAERQLGVKFAADYRSYVLKYGCISGSGMELTGVTGNGGYIDVVQSTLDQREYDDKFPKKAYVIHDWAYDGIVAVQYPNGKIYAMGPGYKTKKMNDSLAEYIAEEIRIDRESEE